MFTPRGSRPAVFAHRGGAALAPENTLAAFDAGLAAGADGLECDVRLSRDGIPVVIHDATLERTTNLSGAVSSRTAAELAAADAGWCFGGDGAWRGRDIGVPALDAVVQRYPGVPIIIELKEDGRLTSAVVDVVRRLGASDRVCLGSFHPGALTAVRRHAPDILTSAAAPEVRWTLCRARLGWPVLPARPYKAFQVPEVAGRVRVVSPAFVRHVHREGQAVQVWVVDDPDDMRRLFDWGVDAIISDRPDIAVRTRDNWRLAMSNSEVRIQNSKASTRPPGR